MTRKLPPEIISVKTLDKAMRICPPEAWPILAQNVSMI